MRTVSLHVKRALLWLGVLALALVAGCENDGDSDTTAESSEACLLYTSDAADE